MENGEEVQNFWVPRRSLIPLFFIFYFSKPLSPYS